MVAESRPAAAITPTQATQGWERFRDDAREAVLTRIVATKSATQAGDQRPSGLVRATVLQRLNAAEALVDISGKAFHIQTKQALTAGSSVVLRIVDDRSFQQSEAPARFQLGPTAGGAGAAVGTAQSAQALRGVAPTPMPAPAALQTGNADANVKLSGASRLLLALDNEQPILQRQAVTLANLNIQASTDPLLAAQRLQQAVSQTGLFYESHLQEWTDGRRSTTALQREPQAALSPGQNRPQAEEAGEGANRPAVTPEQSATRGLQAALNAIPDTLRSLVHEQISVLVTGKMMVEGDWANQPFELEVEPDEASGHDADLPLAWRASITLHTPTLGKLVLKLALHGTQTQLHILPDTQQTRGQALRDLQQHLQQGVMALHEALSNRGIQLAEFQVPIKSRLSGGTS